MSGTRFYVELPGDEDGNTALRKAVIEARLIQGGTPEAAELRNPARKVLLISAPAQIAGTWPRWYADTCGGFAETEGPARMLDRGEYRALVAAITGKEAA